MKVLAFDFGASSGRAILGEFDGSKLTLSELHRFSNDPVEINGTLYWDVLRLFFELKQGLLESKKQGHDDIASIGIDTWGVDFGLLDKQGRLLANPVHYRDSRTDDMMEKAFKLMPREEMYAQTGLQFMQFNTLFQLLALKEQQPELLRQADTLLFTPDLFTYFLTGKKICEYTIASTSQMINPNTRSWNEAVPKALDIKSDMLLPLTPAGTPAGPLSDRIISELGLRSNPTVISVAQHDTASAVMAVPANEEHFAYISSGTWSLLGSETDTPYMDAAAAELNFTNEGGYNGTTRLLKNIMGLWIIQELRREWLKQGLDYSFGKMAEMAETAEGFKCFIDPDDSLFMPQNNMSGRIKEYCKRTGQFVPEQPAEIIRCVLESLALKYRMSLEGLEKILDYSLPVLHVVGGGCQNAALNRYTASAIDRPVIAGPVEATAIGNIMCQLIALKAVPDIKTARRIIEHSFESVTYKPENPEKWDEAYKRFKSLVNNK